MGFPGGCTFTFHFHALEKEIATHSLLLPGESQGWGRTESDTSDLAAGGLVVKNLPAIQEIQVRSLGWEDPLKMEMATHSSILA